MDFGPSVGGKDLSGPVYWERPKRVFLPTHANISDMHIVPRQHFGSRTVCLSRLRSRPVRETQHFSMLISVLTLHGLGLQASPRDAALAPSRPIWLASHIYVEIHAKANPSSS